VGGDRMMEQSKTAQVTDGAFVHAVGDLYRLALRTRPWDTGGVSIPAAINALQLGGAYASLSEDDKFQARVVVIGLVTVDCALEFVYANEANRVYTQAERLKDGRPLSERVMSIGPKLWSESPALHDLLLKTHTALHKT
jgi:hypothetical protein